MNNSLLNRYNKNQFQINLLLILEGGIYLIINFYLQYNEKKIILNQQATFIANAIRNDLINGNHSYVYLFLVIPT
jgi:hypothetical protein